MNKVFFLLAIIISISISPAFAQEVTGQRLTVSADNTAYRYGDIITVSGDVEKILPGTPVILQVFFERTQVDVAQVSVSQNGKFSTTFVAAGPLWVKDGTLIVRIAYGSSIAETTFDFFKKSTEDDFTSNYEVNIPDSGTFDIPYTIRGGTVELISLNQNNLGIDVNINSNSDGYLQLKIYRDYIDSIKSDGTDEDFIVLISTRADDNPVQSEFRKIETTDAFRVIEIPLKNGDSVVSIIGTFAIPEFGTIAAIVLAVAIIAIIGVTSKSRLSLNNF